MAQPGAGGILGQIFGPAYGAMTKSAPAPVPAIVAPVVDMKPKSSKKKPQQEQLPTVTERETATPILMPEIQGLTMQKPMTVEELLDAAQQLGLDKPREVEMPSALDLGDLMPDQAALQEQLSNMPVDIRPIANLMDTIYKTNVSSRTPNLPDEYLTQMRAKAGLMDGGQAIKQVMGQARLAEFKAKLDEWSATQGAQSPLERAKTLDYLRKAMGGGGGPEAAAVARANIGIRKENAESIAAANKENRQIAKEIRQDEREFTRELEKDPILVNYQTVKSRTARARQALTSQKTGVADTTGVREYLKALEDSAVMFNEQESIDKGQGLVERARSFLPNFIEGGKLGELAKSEMMRLLDEFEEIAKADSDAAIASKLQQAADAGISPGRIKKSIDKRLQPKPDVHRYILNGQVVEVEGQKLTRFLKKHPNAKKMR